MKTQEIRELSTKDLRERIDTEKANYVRTKLNHTISPAEDTSKLSKTRRNIARMLTILSQNETNNNQK